MKYEVLVKFHKDFVEVKGKKITVGVMSRPEKGKANAEVIEKIARHFGAPKSSVRIVSGVTSKRKVIEITN